MGCASSSPVGLEASMEELKTNPAKGLKSVNFALGQPQEEASCKASVPKVLELLPNALFCLTMDQKDAKAVTAACAIIERCVKLTNDPSVGISPPTISAEHIEKCTFQLIALLNKALAQGKATHNEHFMEDERCSSHVKAIAGAMEACLKLEDHVEAFSNAFKKVGLKVAMGCLSGNSGLTMDAQQALVSMFAALLESPNNVEAFIGAQGTYALVPYCADPKSYSASREFQQECMCVLETCINSGKEVKNRADVEKAIETAKKDPEGWGQTFSQTFSKRNTK